MRDEPDPESPFLILRRADPHPMRGRSTADLEPTCADPGPPPRVPCEEDAGPPGDLYDGTDLQLLAMRVELQPAPVVLASRALFAALEALAPGMLAATPLEVVGPGDTVHDFVALVPHAGIDARGLADARPGDLQWGPVALAIADAPAQIFQLQGRGTRHLVVARSIGQALDLGSFHDVHLSAFHRTPAEGGARPAMAEVQRLLAKRRD